MNEWAVWCGGVVMAGNVIASNEEEEEGLGLADPAQHSTLGHMVMPITIMTIAIAVELMIVPIEVCVCRCPFPGPSIWYHQQQQKQQHKKAAPIFTQLAGTQLVAGSFA